MNGHPARFAHPLSRSSLSVAAVNMLLTSVVVGSKESKKHDFVSFAIITTVHCGAGGSEPVGTMDAFSFAQLDVRPSSRPSAQTWNSNASRPSVYSVRQLFLQLRLAGGKTRPARP